MRTKIAEPDVVKHILSLAYLNNYVNLRTQIFVYKKENVIFALQEVENLGVFIEYEENNKMENMQSEQKRTLIISRLNELGLDLGIDYNCKKVYMMLHK